MTAIAVRRPARMAAAPSMRRTLPPGPRARKRAYVAHYAAVGPDGKELPQRVRFKARSGITPAVAGLDAASIHNREAGRAAGVVLHMVTDAASGATVW